MGVEWDYYGFWGKLGEIQGMLADLYAIDHILEESPQVIGGTAWGDNLGPVQLGRTKPFTVSLVVDLSVASPGPTQPPQPSPGASPTPSAPSPSPSGPAPPPSSPTAPPSPHPTGYPPSMAPLTDRVAHWYAEADAWASGVVTPMLDEITDLAAVTTSDIQAAVTSLQAMVSKPLEVLVGPDFAKLDKHLGDFHGEAADNFKDYFYDEAVGATEAQRALTEIVCFGLAGSKMIIDFGQCSMIELVTAVHTLLDDQLQRRKDENRPEPGFGLVGFLLIGGAVLAAVAAIPTGGTSLEIAAGLGAVTGNLMIAAGTGLDLSKDGVEQDQVGDDKAETIADQLVTKMGTILSRVGAQWSQLETDLTALEGSLDGCLKLTPLSPPMPDLAHGAGPADFYHESSGRW